MDQVDTVIRPELQASKDLQKSLTEPLHQTNMDALLRSADETTKTRLNSLTTPHATAWTTCSLLVAPLSPEEFRAALRWIYGLPFRAANYQCPDCGKNADCFGLHAVTCVRSAYITRGHHALRDTMSLLYAKAGLHAEIEQPLPGRDERPADLLTSTTYGTPLAIDFTIVTPTRPSDCNRLPTSSTTTLLDQTAALKDRKSRELCTRVVRLAASHPAQGSPAPSLDGWSLQE